MDLTKNRFNFIKIHWTEVDYTLLKLIGLYYNFTYFAEVEYTFTEVG